MYGGYQSSDVPNILLGMYMSIVRHYSEHIIYPEQAHEEKGADRKPGISDQGSEANGKHWRNLSERMKVV